MTFAETAETTSTDVRLIFSRILSLRVQITQNVMNMIVQLNNFNCALPKSFILASSFAPLRCFSSVLRDNVMTAGRKINARSFGGVTCFQ